MAFATNVLGHFTLTQRLLKRDLLAASASVIVLTGDIYILHDGCTPDYSYNKPSGGQAAYCRSKLGNLWFARELLKRNPGLRVYVVHPGVVSSGLTGKVSAPVEAIKRHLLLTNEQGAQTTLICATQPGLVNGGYYHNTMGLMQLRPDDPACNTERSARLWAQLEELAASYL